MAKRKNPDTSELTDEFVDNNGWLLAVEAGFKYHKRPTQSILSKWLRKNHYIKVLPDYTSDGWSCVVYLTKKYFDLGYSNNFIDKCSSFEDAMKKGLQAALKILIDKKNANDQA